MGKAGVIGGSVLGLASLAVIALAITFDAPLEYLAGILGAVAGLVGVYLYARKRKVEDAEQRTHAVERLFKESVYPRSRGGDSTEEASAPQTAKADL